MLESLANTVLSRIEHVLYADSLTQDPSLAIAKWNHPLLLSPLCGLSSPRLSSAADTPSSMTLSDFIGWDLDRVETDIKKNNSTGNLEAYFKDATEKSLAKLANITPKKFSYIDKIECGLTSPKQK